MIAVLPLATPAVTLEPSNVILPVVAVSLGTVTVDVVRFRLPDAEAS